ncbi:MAG: hypothetical protein IPG63_17540 [Xanthomonadales bacterium]|nr:hypothetical protein [Xanthomonadales bacterium]
MRSAHWSATCSTCIGWLRRRAAWSAAHTQVLDALQRLLRRGVDVVHIPGNHDGPLRRWCGLALPGVRMRRRAVHHRGRAPPARHPWRRVPGRGGALAAPAIGRASGCTNASCSAAIVAGTAVSTLRLSLLLARGAFGRQSSGAERYIARFRAAVLADVRRRGLDGVVCGHIHRPELREIDGLVYANDGDRVEARPR